MVLTKIIILTDRKSPGRKEGHSMSDRQIDIIKPANSVDKNQLFSSVTNPVLRDVQKSFVRATAGLRQVVQDRSSYVRLRQVRSQSIISQVAMNAQTSTYLQTAVVVSPRPRCFVGLISFILFSNPIIQHLILKR